MVSVAPSESRKNLVSMAKSLAMQPMLFIRALPYVTIQLSTYGVSFLKRPVVWIALGVHVILLVLPAVDLSAPKIGDVVETEPEEEVTIEAVSLSDILAPAEPAPPPPEEPQAPTPEAPPAPVVAPPVLTEVPEQLEEIIEEEEFEEEFDEEFAEFEEEEPSFGFDPAQQSSLNSSLSQFLGTDPNNGTNNFDITSEWLTIDLTDPIDLRFRSKAVENVVEPAAFFTTESIVNGTYLPLPQVSFKQIARNIDLVSREGLGQALISAGMSQVEEGLYGGHPFYGVYSADEQPVNYISLIDLKGTTLVFVWPNDPRQS
ncbi:hypothetical protein D0962_05255 [Leptolyngbyaceae cyanobacterium CCMR0082]|uniref:Uncharacterized protein n=2 Tax=Adonisia TaxID=2950183 RepID=A0A6M0S179_9CYAN|nr:hypothetical protein [Adonisia turfae CCMR0082]